MKYEKFDKDGVPYIRITVSDHEKVERPMNDADKELFKESDVAYSPGHVEEEAPPNEPVPAEPYPEGP